MKYKFKLYQHNVNGYLILVDCGSNKEMVAGSLKELFNDINRYNVNLWYSVSI